MVERRRVCEKRGGRGHTNALPPASNRRQKIQEFPLCPTHPHRRARTYIIQQRHIKGLVVAQKADPCLLHDDDAGKVMTTTGCSPGGEAPPPKMRANDDDGCPRT